LYFGGIAPPHPPYVICVPRKDAFFSINDIDILKMWNYSYIFNFCFAHFFLGLFFFLLTENGFLCLIIYCNPGRFSLFSNQFLCELYWVILYLIRDQCKSSQSWHFIKHRKPCFMKIRVKNPSFWLVEERWLCSNNH
jgi:hypothetical protein